MIEPTLGAEQQAVFDHVVKDRGNVLISGPAGVGKSFLLEHIVRTLRLQGRATAVTASTGIAALNVGGSTIHSFLGTGILDNIDALHKVYTKLETNARTAGRIQDTDVLVVDEVSMLTGDYLEMASRWLGYVRQKRRGQVMTPFGGLQMIFVGDFLQLPPVQTGYGHRAKHLYAFQHPVWTEATIKPFVLRQNFRQEDAAFVQHLLTLREGSVPAPTRAFFKPCVGRLLGQPTWLLSRNDAAQARNLTELRKITGKVRRYEATTHGPEQWQEAIRKNCIAEETLVLKAKAPVIFLVNNKDLGIVNGMRGVVTGVGPDAVSIQKPSGEVVTVGRHTWKLNDASGTALASLTQFPVKLAWALTIHKSQGMTLDSVRCDLSSVFETGHAYVAMSRARSVEGLALAHPLVPGQIRAAREAVQFYERLAA